MAAGSRDSQGTAAGAQPWWRQPGWWLRAVFTYVLALVGGYIASRLSVPLPWMLGPFFLCGAFAAFGARLAFLPMGRELGQLAVGLAVGLRFTPATLAATLGLLPAMLAATAYVVVFTFIAALIFIVRPVSVYASTLGSGLTLAFQQRALLEAHLAERDVDEVRAVRAELHSALLRLADRFGGVGRFSG